MLTILPLKNGYKYTDSSQISTKDFGLSMLDISFKYKESQVGVDN